MSIGDLSGVRNSSSNEKRNVVSVCLFIDFSLGKGGGQVLLIVLLASCDHKLRKHTRVYEYRMHMFWGQQRGCEKLLYCCTRGNVMCHVMYSYRVLYWRSWYCDIWYVRGESTSKLLGTWCRSEGQVIEVPEEEIIVLKTKRRQLENEKEPTKDETGGKWKRPTTNDFINHQINSGQRPK